LQPRALRVLRLSGLAGFETGSEVPFLGTRLDLRIGRRIGFLASGELLWLHTPSIVRQDEYRGGQLIDSTIVERDHVWQRAIRIGLGAELSFR
jgi:hypothetical protein